MKMRMHVRGLLFVRAYTLSVIGRPTSEPWLCRKMQTKSYPFCATTG